MTTLFTEDFDKICRCCLCKNGEMRPLFESCIDNMLRFVADIDVQAGDSLPEQMCVPCVLQVSRAFTFKQQCQRSDQTLRAFVDDQIGKNKSDTNEFPETYKHADTSNIIGDAIDDVKIDKSVANHLEEHEQFSEIDDTATDHLDSQLDLDSLPAEIEDDIELSNLTSSLGDDDDIQRHLNANVLNSDNELTATVTKVSKTVPPSKCDDYFNGIKLDVRNVISLTDNELPEQSIDGTFDDIPVVESDIDAKKITTDFIDDILSSENHSTINCSMCNVHFESQEKLDVHSKLVHLNKITDPTSTTTIATISTENAKKNACHECPNCHKVFAESKILRRHLKIHSPVKPHQCPECSMSFAESSNLRKHMKKHTGELRNVVGKPENFTTVMRDCIDKQKALEEAECACLSIYCEGLQTALASQSQCNEVSV